jgi:hypothetical protein
MKSSRLTAFITTLLLVILSPSAEPQVLNEAEGLRICSVKDLVFSEEKPLPPNNEILRRCALQNEE